MSENTVVVTHTNWKPEGLRHEWGRPAFTTEDGIGPLGSLFEAGDAIAAIGKFVEGDFIALGSGVMIAPGILLTATHVLKEFSKGDLGPVISLRANMT